MLTTLHEGILPNKVVSSLTPNIQGSQHLFSQCRKFCWSHAQNPLPGLSTHASLSCSKGWQLVACSCTIPETWPYVGESHQSLGNPPDYITCIPPHLWLAPVIDDIRYKPWHPFLKEETPLSCNPLFRPHHVSGGGSTSPETLYLSFSPPSLSCFPHSHSFLLRTLPQ